MNHVNLPGCNLWITKSCLTSEVLKLLSFTLKTSPSVLSKKSSMVKAKGSKVKVVKVTFNTCGRGPQKEGTWPYLLSWGRSIPESHTVSFRYQQIWGINRFCDFLDAFFLINWPLKFNNIAPEKKKDWKTSLSFLGRSLFRGRAVQLLEGRWFFSVNGNKNEKKTPSDPLKIHQSSEELH